MSLETVGAERLNVNRKHPPMLSPLTTEMERLSKSLNRLT